MFVWKLCKYFTTQSSFKCHSWWTRSQSLPAAAHRAAAARPSTPPEPRQAALHPHTRIGHSTSNQSHGVTPLQALLMTEKWTAQIRGQKHVHITWTMCFSFFCSFSWLSLFVSHIIYDRVFACCLFFPVTDMNMSIIQTYNVPRNI